MPDEQLSEDVQKVKEFEEKLKALCEEHKVNVGATITFPQYKILPPEVELALKIIERQGGIYQVLYTLKKQ